MSRLYLRQVVLTVTPSSGQSKVLRDLRIRFKAVKNEESKPNTMEIEVFNLSEKSRSLLEGKNTSLVLEAGYDGSTSVIFKGNITRVNHELEEADIISKIEAADGGSRYRKARIEKGIPPGAKTKQVIDELVKSLGLTQGPILGVPNTQYANGISLSGLAKDRLDDVCRKNRLQWSIQDGVVQIIPEAETTQDSAVLVSPDSGLIGSPTRTKTGVEFKMLLQPNLRPGRKVKLESRFIKGEFKVSRVDHSGDSHEGDFLSECEAIAYGKGKAKK